MLRFACMAKAYEHMKSAEAANYFGLTMQSIASANASNELWRRSQYIG
jgi:hypothetical protein